MLQTEESKRLFKYATITFIVLSVFLVTEAVHSLLSLKNVGRSVMPTNLVTVSGQGEVFSVPDVASFNFGTTVTAKTVADAQKQVTEKMNKALDVLKKYNIEDRDFKTVSYNVNPHYEYIQSVCSVGFCPPGRSQITGYDVSQSVSVKVRKVEDAGSILGEMGSLGLTEIGGIQFTIDDEDALRAEARVLAIAEAKEKAGVLAKELGVKLGKIVSFYEDSNSPMPYNKFGMGGDAMISSASIAPELSPGENKIVSSVSITYEIR